MARFDQLVFNQCIFGQMTRNYLWEILDFHDFWARNVEMICLQRWCVFLVSLNISVRTQKNLQVGHYCLAYKKLHILQLSCRNLGCNIVTASSSSCSLTLLQFSTISTVCRLPSAVCCLPFAVCRPPSTLHCLSSTVYRLPSSACCLPIATENFQSVNYDFNIFIKICSIILMRTNLWQAQDIKRAGLTEGSTLPMSLGIDFQKNEW